MNREDIPIYAGFLICLPFLAAAIALVTIVYWVAVGLSKLANALMPKGGSH